MREILFRGVSVINGEWVEGYPVKSINGKYYLITYATEDSINTKNEVDFIYQKVKPETIGQLAGIKGYIGEFETRHQNEIKLFEGDVVEAWSQGSKGTFVIQYIMNEFMLFPAFQHGKLWKICGSDVGRKKGDYYDDLKRIGNIHDNPELLEDK